MCLLDALARCFEWAGLRNKMFCYIQIIDFVYRSLGKCIENSLKLKIYIYLYWPHVDRILAVRC